jgi:hypothetical protein
MNHLCQFAQRGLLLGDDDEDKPRVPCFGILQRVDKILNTLYRSDFYMILNSHECHYGDPALHLPRQ